MKLSSQIKGAVTRLKNAAIDEAFKGAGDPADHEAIELRLKLAQAKFNELMALVDQLESS